MPYDVFGYYHSEETRKKISDTMKKKGIHKGVDNPSSRKVVQLTKDGEYIKTWDYMSQIVEELEEVNNISSISAVCRGVHNKKIRLKSAYGYRWMYAEDYFLWGR